MLQPGDPVPSFFARGLANPNYAFDSVAGLHVVLSFIGSTQWPGTTAFLNDLYHTPGPFDDRFACAFVVSADPEDEAGGRLQERYPGVRVFWDMDGALRRVFGLSAQTGDAGFPATPCSLVLDPGLRLRRIIPLTDPQTHFQTLCSVLDSLRPEAPDMLASAPVLTIPHVIEPELCREFIAYAQRTGLEDSGYMKTDPETGKTQLVVNYGHKRRSDCTIEDEHLRKMLQDRIKRRIVPQIERAFQFKVTRMERYLIAAYDAQAGGHFRPHKDNTTLGTAHRRFAVTINLNPDEYEGGDLRFPEFGPRTYRAPMGGAIVFSCSLLHEATPMISGTRYCILPFLYDEAAAAIRLKNAEHLADPQLRKSVIASVMQPPEVGRAAAAPQDGRKKSRRLKFR